MIESKVKWMIPCYFNDNKPWQDAMEINLTSHLNTFLKNKVWERKLNYGSGRKLIKSDFDNIIDVKARIYSRHMAVFGLINRRPLAYIQKECFSIPPYFKYNNWGENYGLVVIELTYNYAIHIPSTKEVENFNYKEKFYPEYSKHTSILKELGTFLITCLHLTYPTKSIMGWNDEPIHDGILYYQYGKKVYTSALKTNTYMHHILVERDQMSRFLDNIESLAAIWHLDLWSIKRYLISVESNMLSMDNLLDLIYCLEGLFDKHASVDFIKTFCIVSLCEDKKSANILREWLRLAYNIRNEIAHGGDKFFSPNDEVKFQNRKVYAQEVYWEMKRIVVLMLSRAILKLENNNGMKNLRFNENDLINLILKKRVNNVLSSPLKSYYFSHPHYPTLPVLTIFVHHGNITAGQLFGKGHKRQRQRGAYILRYGL